MHKILGIALIGMLVGCGDDNSTNNGAANNAAKTCVADAAAVDCDCTSDSTAWIVSGTGATCAIVSEAANACYSNTDTCLNNCVDEFYAYDQGDGTRLIVRALQGQMSDGWVSEGQGSSPGSCPTIEAPLEF